MEKFHLKIRKLRKSISNQLIQSFRRALGIYRDASDSTSTSTLQVSTEKLSDTYLNCWNYILASQRMHEIETQKAMAILMSRHERWKGAGGPN